MSKTVRHLRAVTEEQTPPPEPPEPDQDVLALCTELLRRAKAGEIRSIGVAADMTDDTSLIKFEVAPPFNGLVAFANCQKLANRVHELTEPTDPEEF